MKTITLEVKGASQTQWLTFVLELNIMKKMWKSYGVDVELRTTNLNKMIVLGNDNGESARRSKRNHY